ncbi:mechanosensitive ion channel [Runella sp. MFBS21]|uniref:mechanosensitive ion channel family protein n=1 Tax=Runella sp. MFBS21 TaxID=3034018 RepID=UPI0023F67C86|nr:mechanosensitive ion channel domain-containing protein [Runella sp. MFBS21]MDF7816377.1 mechanosensitive ion channel [Runella sp. MFBS21]
MKELPNLTEVLISTLTKLINQFVDFVPRFIFAAFILLIGYLVAKGISIILKKVLEKIGFDRIGEKLNEISIVKQLQTEIKLSQIVSKVLYYFIMLGFITDATRTLGVGAITGLVEKLVNFVPQLIVAAIMLQIGVLVAETLKNAVVSICKSFNVPSAKLIGSIVFSFFSVITLISALGQAGINTELLESSFNLIIGGIILAFAVGYGFASRDVLSNLLASFYNNNRFQLGQTIQIDEIKGKIIHIDNTSITLQTGDSQTVFPLQVIQSKKITVFDN